MLRSLKELKGYQLAGEDDDVGTVSDFLFDDARWAVRYLVVDTGGWLDHRTTLVSPVAVSQADWESRTISVRLTREQVEHSPPIERHEPVSRQHEQDLHQFYGWPYYWGGVGAWGSLLTPGALALEPPPPPGDPVAPPDPAAEGDPHLQSADEVMGYHVLARDEEAGHVEDLVADDESWSVRYLVVDTRNWLPGRKVLIAPAWVERFSWADRQAVVDVSRAQIEGAPEFERGAPVNRRYEAQLYDYYGRPTYWEE